MMERSDITINDDASINFDIVFSVTDKNTVCTLHYQDKAVTRALCKTEYKNELSNNSLREDEYNVLSRYIESDIDDFEECIKSIAVVKE